MTTTEILKAIQAKLQAEFCTTENFISAQGVTCEIEIEHESNVHFYIEYRPSEQAIETLQTVIVSTWFSIGITKPKWLKGDGYPAHRLFIQGAFPLLYAERFAEVCEIEAINEFESDEAALERAENYEELRFRMANPEY